MRQFVTLRGLVFGLLILVYTATGLCAQAQNQFYRVSIEDGTPTRNDADAAISGTLGVKPAGIVYASSPEDAVWKSLTGTITVTFNGQFNQVFDENQRDQAYRVGTNTALGGTISGVAGDQLLVVIDDTYPTGDGDYNDFYWEVSAVPYAWSGDLDLVVGEVDLDDAQQMADNAAREEDIDSGGIEVLPLKRIPVWALIPDGLNDDPGENAEAVIEFNLPDDVVIYDDDLNVLDKDRDEWDAGEGPRQYWIETYSNFSNQSIRLYLKDLGGQTVNPDQDIAYVSVKCPECDPVSASCYGCVENYFLFRIGLGTTRYGEDAGYLTLASPTFSTALAAPAALQPMLHEDLVASNLGSNGGTIIPRVGTNQSWGGMEVDTSPTSGADYALHFYEDLADIGTPANAYRTVEVDSPAANTLRVVETQTIDGMTTTRYWEFTYDGTSGNEWEMEEGAVNGGTDTALKIERGAETVTGTTRTKTITRETPGTSAVVYQAVETWEDYAWGSVITKRVTGTGANALVEQWVYGTDSTKTSYGQLERYFSGTGYWEFYEYTQTTDEFYRSKTIKQLDDYVLAPTTSMTQAIEDANIVVEEYRYPPSSTPISVTTPATEVTYQKFTTAVANTLASTTFVVRTHTAEAETAGSLEQWIAVGTVADPQGALSNSAYVTNIVEGDATGSLITKTSRHALQAPSAVPDDSQPGHISRIDYPDGQTTLLTRTKDSNLDFVVVAKDGYLSGSNAVQYGSQVTRTLNVRGSTIRELYECASQPDNSGSLFIKSLSKIPSSLDVDELGRPKEIDYFFGQAAADEVANPSAQDTPDYTEYWVHGCCGSGTERRFTDRAGVARNETFDALGRLTGVTPALSTSGDVLTQVVYDAADRVIQTTIKPTDSLLPDHVSTAKYDKANRLTVTEDAEGRRMFYTYQRVSSSGNGVLYNPTGDPVAGEFYWETRVYGHDRAGSTDPTPAIQVTWTDSHGRTIRSWTASTTATWSDTSPPNGLETLTEESRTTMKYPWVDWSSGGTTYTRLQVEQWVYHDLPALGSDGALETNYLVARKVLADPAGRVFRTNDAASNITENRFDDEGRVEEVWFGVDAADLHMITKRVYKEFRNGVEQSANDRPWPGRTYTVKPGLAEAPDETDLPNDYVYTDAVESHTVLTSNAQDYMSRRFIWSRPQHQPWKRWAYEEEGRPFDTRTYRNGSDTYELTRTAYEYWDTSDSSDGKLNLTKRFRVTAGSATNNWLETRNAYDDAGRLFKVNNIGRGYTKVLFDEYGRIDRTLFGSNDGADVDVATDDTLLTESVPTYDKTNRVLQTVDYERNHDATVTGLLSAPAAASQVRASYRYAWYDNDGRFTHKAVTGTTALSVYTAGSANAPASSADVLVDEIEYDTAGRVDVMIDPLGKKTKRIYDDLGRVQFSIGSWDGSITDASGAASPVSRDGDVNQITQTIYDYSAMGGGVRKTLVAVDPDGDGVTTDNQSTLYLHSGEVLDANNRRGYIPVNGRQIAVVMPDAEDSGGGELDRTEAITEINTAGEVFGDFTFTEYYANGQVQRMTDQRGVQKNYFYTDEGWLDYKNITLATGGTWTAVGDLRKAYTYGDIGEALTVTSYSDAAGTTITSQIQNAYDGFYNLVTEYQQHGAAVNTSTSPSVQYAYDTSLSGSYYDKAYRLKTTTYPNGRVIHHTYDGHVVDGASIDDRIARANGLADDSTTTPGTPGDSITAYSYLGSGRVAIKDLPTPEIKLDYFGGTPGTYAGLDKFNRITDQRWVAYGGSADEDLIHIAHDYDQNSRRLYDYRKKSPSYSKAYEWDKLDRISSYSLGNLKLDSSTPPKPELTAGVASTTDFWTLIKEDYNLDSVGNALNMDDETTDDRTVQSFNAANEQTELESHTDIGEDLEQVEFNDAGDKDLFEAGPGMTSAQFTDNVSVDASGSNALKIDLDSGQERAAILSQVETGAAPFETEVKAPAGHTGGGQAGIIFGYKSDLDYWMLVKDFGDGLWKVYHVYDANDNGQIDYDISPDEKFRITNVGGGTGTGGGSWKSLRARAASNAMDLPQDTSLAGEGGFPSGRWGFYTEIDGVEFDYLRLNPPSFGRQLSASWLSKGGARLDDAGSGDGRMYFFPNPYHQTSPSLLQDLRAQRFEVTFSMTRWASNAYARLQFVFNYQNTGEYDIVQVFHDGKN
ncbi:MAG: hypothetical protein AAGC72_05265, partial [Planctomycetota bacterium]